MAGGFLERRRKASLSRRSSSRSTSFSPRSSSSSTRSVDDTSLNRSRKSNSGSPKSVTSKKVEQGHSDGRALIRTPTSDTHEEWDIYVRTLSGRQFCIMVHPHDTIDHIKMKIRMKEGISEDQQRLLFKGIQLQDGCLLDWDLYDLCVIFLTLRLRGG